MSDTEKKATLQLRVVGPLDGDDAPPVGAAAWISVGDDEPLVVMIPVGPMHESANVAVSPGRVVVILRCPSGNCGRREFVLSAGEVKSIEFGKAKRILNIVGADVVIETLELPAFGGGKQPTMPIDPNRVEQDHPPLSPVDPIDGGFGGAIAGTGLRGGASSDGTIHWGKYGPYGTGGNGGLSWMPQIQKVHVILQPHPSSGKLVKCVVKQNAIPQGLHSFQSSTMHLELGMVGCFAFVVEPTAPHQDKVLFHRAPWTHQLTRFTIKPRHDATAIPIDTEVFLADENVMPLLSFLASGDISSARAAGARFSEVAGGYLSRKFTNHHLAIVGAYALHVLRETAKYENWIHTLYKHFDDTSDGAILYAMHLMRARPGAISEWYDEARTALVEAAARPIPLLTVGVQLLVDGLERLASSRRSAGDEKIENALLRAHWIQSRARPDEIFTALWMDSSDLPKAFLPHDFHEIFPKQ